MSLFDGVPDGPAVASKGPPHPMPGAPLAERMRPRTLEEYSGQDHLLGPGKPLRVQIERDDPGSMIFWVRQGSARPPSPKSSRRQPGPISLSSPPS